ATRPSKQGAPAFLATGQHPSTGRHLLPAPAADQPGEQAGSTQPPAGATPPAGISGDTQKWRIWAPATLHLLTRRPVHTRRSARSRAKNQGTPGNQRPSAQTRMEPPTR